MCNTQCPASDAEGQKSQQRRYNRLFARYLDRPDKLAKFQEYHRKNPEVYKLFAKLAQQWKDAGHDRGSATLFGNVIRWRIKLLTDSEDGFKLCNDWLPMFARLLVLKDASFEGFFLLTDVKPEVKRPALS